MGIRIADLDGRTVRTFGAITAGIMVGNLVNFLAPLVVGSLTKHGELSVSEAGYVISAEFAAIALAAIIIGPRIHLVSKRSLAMTGCTLSVLLNLVSIMVVGSLQTLMSVRFAAGLAEGLTMASAGAAVAAMTAPDRVFALVKVINALVTALAMMVGGVLVARYGVAGCYGALAAFTAALLPAMLWMPVSPAADQHATKPAVREPMPHLFLGCCAIGGLVFWMTSISLGWPFIARFGEQSGLAIEHVSAVLSATVAMGMLGGLMAAWLRINRVMAIAIGASGCGIAWVMIGSSVAPAVFVMGAVLNSISYYFTTPFVLGMSAALDDRGRWSAIATSSLLIGMMIAPLIGGNILEAYGSTVLGVIIAITQGMAIAIMAFVGKRAAAVREAHVGNTVIQPA